MMQTVWCLEDESSVRELELYTLCSAGFDAAGFECAEELFVALREKHPDLLLLDIMLPDADGITVLKRIRMNPDITGLPVILATAKGTEMDKVTGLDNGADDYLVKPFGMMEMISHIRAVLRRTGDKPNENAVLFGGIRLSVTAHTVWIDETQLELSMKEFELLRLLLIHPGRVYTREELLAAVWDSNFTGETRTVDMHIANLRTKLGEKGRMIKTVRGLGYKMELPV